MIKLLGALCLVIGVFGIFGSVQGCRQDWDNQCDKDEECCSKYCRRDRPDWATGVCDPQDTRPTTRSTRSMTSTTPFTTTTTSTSTTTTRRPVIRGRCSWYGEARNSSNSAVGENQDKPENMYTSCGDIYHKNVLAAAQLKGIAKLIRGGGEKLACGTRIRVTNEESTDLLSRSVDVVVNDDINHKTSRILSLTSGAFQKISDPQNRNHIACSFIVLDS